MGRYSSVQAYADNNNNMRAVSYDQATGSAEGAAKPSGGVVKTEKVTNPYGSAAGAGSGEFHVYRHARAREMARWKELEETEKEQKLDEEFKKKQADAQTEEEKKTAQRRKKRQRQKEAKQRKKNLALSGVKATEEDTNHAVADDEFSYTPMCNGKAQHSESSEAAIRSEADGAPTDALKKLPPKLEFANDGSFLEMMKKKLAEEAAANESEGEGGPPIKKLKPIEE
mmetsp:Transcript_19378/g.28681  ORF Transcript_19378/g.28681 Transcript_19378/m.28681 type:complete len:227 (-) Transcript_19378:853-1533(-)